MEPDPINCIRVPPEYRAALSELRADVAEMRRREDGRLDRVHVRGGAPRFASGVTYAGDRGCPTRQPPVVHSAKAGAKLVKIERGHGHEHGNSVLR
jgi:hypothetical protein